MSEKAEAHNTVLSDPAKRIHWSYLRRIQVAHERVLLILQFEGERLCLKV